MSKPDYLPSNKEASPLTMKFYRWYIKTVKTFGSSTKRINTFLLIGYDNKTLENVQAKLFSAKCFNFTVRGKSFNRSRIKKVLECLFKGKTNKIHAPLGRLVCSKPITPVRWCLCLLLI